MSQSLFSYLPCQMVPKVPIVGDWQTGDPHAVHSRKVAGKMKPPTGTRRVQRSYAAGVGGSFLVGNNCSYYPLQKANPRGETHVLSGFHKIRKKYVMPQFHVKGFVNQCVNRSHDRWKKLVWTTESIEDVPARCARETYVIADQNEFR
jgi:hypothetical protein